MKIIKLHKIDESEVIEDDYNWRKDKFERYIPDSKEKFKFIFFLHKDGIKLIEESQILEIPIQEKKRYFDYSLNCISEFCRLAHFPNQEKEAQIDDTGIFTIKVEETNEHVNMLKALSMATIARDEAKQKNIANSPFYFWGIKEEDYAIENFAIGLLKLLKIYYDTKKFDATLYAICKKDVEKDKSFIGPDVKKLFWVYEYSKYLEALKSLVDNDEALFNKNLILALEAHKEVWSQKKALNRGGTPFCRENEGFLSWGCTALAAMAYDKGWQLAVESDYMPSFMVDGSINK